MQIEWHRVRLRSTWNHYQCLDWRTCATKRTVTLNAHFLSFSGSKGADFRTGTLAPRPHGHVLAANWEWHVRVISSRHASMIDHCNNIAQRARSRRIVYTVYLNVSRTAPAVIAMFCVCVCVYCGQIVDTVTGSRGVVNSIVTLVLRPTVVTRVTNRNTFVSTQKRLTCRPAASQKNRSSLPLDWQYQSRDTRTSCRTV